MGRLSLSVEAGDTIQVGDSVITFEEKTGRRIRIRIESNEDVAHQKAGASRETPSRKPVELTKAATPPSNALKLTRLMIRGQ